MTMLLSQRTKCDLTQIYRHIKAGKAWALTTRHRNNAAAICLLALQGPESTLVGWTEARVVPYRELAAARTELELLITEIQGQG